MKKTESIIKQKEKGQILVILAVSMVVLLGFTALAVDGSAVYNDRRHDQSTADSAALAGAGAAAQILKDHKPSEFSCGSTLGADASTAAVAAAQEAALQDSVTLTVNDLTTNGVQVVCGQDKFRKYLDIKVHVTSVTPTTFAKIFSRNSLTTSVDATARVYPQQIPAFGNAIASLSKSCGNIGGIILGGTSKIKINKGGIFSNSCIDANGGPQVDVIGGDVQWFTAYYPPSSGYIHPNPIQTTERLPEIDIPAPTCANTPYVSAPGNGTIGPGNYKGIDVIAQKTLTLKPGLYCMKGDLSANAHSILYANGVTFYFISGGVHFNGTAELHLSAPNCESTSCPDSGVPPAIRGILMYFDPANQATIILNGSSYNEYMGTIYAPNSLVKINGTSDNDTFHTQIIANRVEFIGTAKMYMDLEGAELYQIPSSIELLK